MNVCVQHFMLHMNYLFIQSFSLLNTEQEHIQEFGKRNEAKDYDQ